MEALFCRVETMAFDSECVQMQECFPSSSQKLQVDDGHDHQQSSTMTKLTHHSPDFVLYHVPLFLPSPLLPSFLILG